MSNHKNESAPGIPWDVEALISNAGRTATLTGVWVGPESEPHEPRPLGIAKCNEFGFWVSHTPLGTRYYTTPHAVGYDRILFAHYRRDMHWEHERVTEKDLARWRRNQPGRRVTMGELVSHG